MPHSDWVSPVQVVPKKGGMTVIENSKNKLIPKNHDGVENVYRLPKTQRGNKERPLSTALH
jgi:hypothetical protein